MHLKSCFGRLTQLRDARPGLWWSFVTGWLNRQRGFVPCVVPGCREFLYVPLRDFYESYGFFCEQAQGRHELAYFLGKIKPGDVLYDVGAFRGVFGAACKLKWARGISVHSFEPIKKNTEAIEHIRHLNHFTDFVIVPSAVGDGNGLPANEQDDMLCAGDASKSQGAPVVRTVSLDQYVADGHPAPTIMKIDVEGYEVQVLTGARECLTNHRPRLWLEVHPGFLKAQNKSADDVLGILRRAGYEISVFEDYDSSGSEVSFHIWCVSSRGLAV